MHDIAILTERGHLAGHGHFVRSRHLFNAVVDEREYGLDVALEMWPAMPKADTLVLDVMRPDLWLREGGLGQVGARRLVVVVGAGWTITNEVVEAADLLVYQAIHPFAMPEKGIGGPEHIILGPWYAPPRMSLCGGALVLFGAGVGRDYQIATAAFLESSGIKTTLVMDDPPITTAFQAQAAWDYPKYELQRLAQVQVGSLGMSTFEALACGTVPVVVGRSPDHVATANALQDMGLCFSLGLLEDVAPRDLAREASTILWPQLEKMQQLGLALGLGQGARRVAQAILRLP